MAGRGFGFDPFSASNTNRIASASRTAMARGLVALAAVMGSRRRLRRKHRAPVKTPPVKQKPQDIAPNSKENVVRMKAMQVYYSPRLCLFCEKYDDHMSSVCPLVVQNVDGRCSICLKEDDHTTSKCPLIVAKADANFMSLLQAEDKPLSTERCEYLRCAVHVTNLPSGTLNWTLCRHFSEVGLLKFFFFGHRKVTAFAYAVFSCREDALEAINNLNGTLYDGSILQVCLAFPDL